MAPLRVMDDSVDRTQVKMKAKTPPPISKGSFVSAGNRKGRVDLIVTDGKVPDAPGDVEGTSDSPAARVVVYEDGKATSTKFAAKVSTLKRIPPFMAKKSAAAELVDMLAIHDARVDAGELPPEARVTGTAVKAVFDRGCEAWPGHTKTVLSREQWGVGRVGAFLSVASGVEVKGYQRDNDLLPARHVEEGDVDVVEEHVVIPAEDVAAAIAALNA